MLFDHTTNKSLMEELHEIPPRKARARDAFILGINYWPARSAMRWWQRFDEDEVERDFARLGRAGFNVVRIFLLWEDFQPTPASVSETMLRRLVRVADITANNGLRLIPTLFTGHMSGVNWLPAWALDFRAPTSPPRFRIVAQNRVVQAVPKNWYADDAIIAAQALLARAVAQTLAGHRAVWAWDLGNENSNCVVPPSREAGISWLVRMSDEIRAADPHRPVTIGLHMEDLEEDRKIGPAEAAQTCDFLCMHGYPLYAGWAENETDEFVLPFLGLVTYWLGGRDVFFEEFGAPTKPPGSEAGVSPFKLLPEDEAARFTRRALASLHRFGLMGAAVWCANDYSEKIWHEPPLDQSVHERFFGLWRADGSAKPAVFEVESFDKRERLVLCRDFSWVDLTPENFYESPRRNLAHLYRRFRTHFADTLRP